MKKKIIAILVILTLIAIIAILAISSYMGSKVEDKVNKFANAVYEFFDEEFAMSFKGEPFKCSGISDITCRSKKITLDSDEYDAVILNDVKISFGGGKKDAKIGMEFDYQTLNMSYQQALEQDFIGKKRKSENNPSLYGNIKCRANAKLKTEGNIDLGMKCDSKIDSLEISEDIKTTINSTYLEGINDMRELLSFFQDLKLQNFEESMLFAMSFRSYNENYSINIKSDNIFQSLNKIFEKYENKKDDIEAVLFGLNMSLTYEIYSILTLQAKENLEKEEVDFANNKKLIEETFNSLNDYEQRNVLFLINYLRLVDNLALVLNDSDINKINIRISSIEDESIMLAQYLFDTFIYFPSMHKMQFVVDSKNGVVFDSSKEDELEYLSAFFDNDPESLFPPNHPEVPFDILLEDVINDSF